MDTQIAEVRRRHLAFEALSAVERQILRWRDLKRDPAVQKRAAEIIGSLGGAKFNIEILQEKHQIYSGYLCVEAQRRGYEQIISGGRGTGTYALKKDGKTHEIHTLKKTIDSQDWLLSQMEAECMEKDKKIIILEAENNSLRKQVATLKKASRKDK